MSYLVEYTGTGTEGQVEPQGPPVYWKTNDVRWVDDECIAFYQRNSSVFTIVKDPSSIKDGVSEGADGLTYVVECIQADEGKMAVLLHMDSAEGDSIVDERIQANFPGTRAAAYIDFNATGEPGMAVTVGSITFQEADTADAANGVFTNGSSAANSAASLIAAINGDERVFLPYSAAADLSGDGVWLYMDGEGPTVGDITTSTPAKVSARPAAMIHFGGAGEAGMKVTIGGVDYQEADTAAPTTGVWTNGASAENSVDSLVAAINGDTRATVPFTAVKVGTADVFISWDDTEETDAFVISETSAANCTVHQASYLLFTGTGAPGATVTIGGIAFAEADPADAPNGVWTNGASAANSATSLIAAINGDVRTAIPFTAVADAGGDGLWLSQDAAGDARAAISIAAASSSCTVTNFNGGSDSAIKSIVNITKTVTANELLSGHIDIPLAFVPDTWTVQAFTSAGAPVYFTDLVTLESEPTDLIRITTDGATNLAATDVVHLVVIG